MSSITSFIKAAASIVNAIQPQIENFTESKRENQKLKEEIIRLEKENARLKKERFFLLGIMLLLSVLFIASFIVIVTGIRCAG